MFNNAILHFLVDSNGGTDRVPGAEILAKRKMGEKKEKEQTSVDKSYKNKIV